MGDKAKARAYLEKYWLSKGEYELLWKPIQDKIFINQEEGMPSLMFNTEFRLIINRSFCLLTNYYFKKLQRCLMEMGEKYFIVIENDFGGEISSPFFRMKFPVDITWKELISGNYISAVIFGEDISGFFIFGSNASWGQYRQDGFYYHPFYDPFIEGCSVTGFKSEYSNIFKSNFKSYTKEKKSHFMGIPPIYRRYVEYV